jgi:hypothetical protein
MDYLDGNLSDRDIQMLEDFLLINPELRAELEGTEKIVLSPEQIVFKQKDLLIRPDLNLPVNENNLEDFCVAAAECDLNDNQLTELNEYIKENPANDKLFRLYARLHLTPDKNIIFTGKEKLKKAIILVPREIFYPLLSVAAAIAFILIIYLREESNTKDVINISAELPVSVKSSPKNETNVVSKEKTDFLKKIPEVQQASVIAFAYPKAKKKSLVTKARDSLEKKNNENKSREILSPQRLNPSFQIKLPSIAENQTNIPIIDKNKITYNSVKATNKSPDYLSLSEYARKQLAEKVLGNKNPLNSHLSGWQIADAGIHGLNKITGGEMSLETRMAEDGRITAYSFNSKLLSFSTTSVK